MKHEDLRRKLIDGTIHVIAKEGLDKATTKQIGLYTNTNEAYIYRCFADKEDMFAKAFDTLDQELFNTAMDNVSVMYNRELPYEKRCRQFFFSVWNFMIDNHDGCLTYVRYYYSPYFLKYSVNLHKQRYLPLVETFNDAFLEEAEVWLILTHILNVMFDFAIKVHDGRMPNSEEFSEHVFRVIYASIKQYFKHS